MTEASENTHDHFQKQRAKLERQRDDLDMQLADITNLVAALQIIAFDYCGQRLEPGSEEAQRRNALVGIANALEARLANA